MNYWSNPTPGGATSAELGNAARIDPVNIGSLVASIMNARQRAAEFQQQQTANAISGIVKGLASASQQYQQNAREGAANDAANAAIYGAQYPNDPYGGYTDPNRVPDYGGVDALEAQKRGLQLQKSQEQIRAEQALEYDRWNKGAGGAAGAPGTPPNIYTDPDTGQQYYNNSRGGWSPVKGVTGAANQLTSKYGISPGTDLEDASQITRINKSGKPDPNGDYVNIGGTMDYGKSKEDTPVLIGGQKVPFNAYVAQARRSQTQQQGSAGVAPSGNVPQSAPTGPNAGLNADTQDAMAAIAAGADRDKVVARLLAKYPGTDFSGL